MIRPLLAAMLICAAMLPAGAEGATTGIPDPAAKGPLVTNRVDYVDGVEVVGEEGGAQWLEDMQGSIHFPITGEGPFPAIVFLHGRHSSCAYVGVEFLGSPCPDTPLTNSVDSYKGYDYIADNLASHGYVVMSVNANGTNTYDTANTDSGAHARSQIIALSLDRLAEWNTQPGPGAVDANLVGKVDFSRIGLMGHSRGGEGVTDFIDYNRTRPPAATGTIAGGPRYDGLKAVFALAPIDRKSQAPHGVAFATLLPYCDGDVSDLSGSRPFERTKYADSDPRFPHIQFGVNGANHNFFNTIWIGDDNSSTTDSACAESLPSTNRLSKDDQKRVGLDLIAAFLRRYVGPEPAFDPLMTGASGLPDSGCPGGVGPCNELLQFSYVGGHRHVIVEPSAADTLSRTADGGALTAAGFTTYSSCAPASNGTGCPAPVDRSTTRQLTLVWDGPATLRAELTGPSADASGYGALTMRAAANYNDARNPAGQSQDFSVALIDRRGRSASVRAAEFAHGAVVPSPGSSQREVVLGGIRIPLSAFRNLDLAHLAAIELRFGEATASGSIQLADLMWQEEAPPSRKR